MRSDVTTNLSSATAMLHWGMKDAVCCTKEVMAGSGFLSELGSGDTATKSRLSRETPAECCLVVGKCGFLSELISATCIFQVA